MKTPLHPIVDLRALSVLGQIRAYKEARVRALANPARAVSCYFWCFKIVREYVESELRPDYPEFFLAA